ncbi:hypothetical protein A6R68_23568, partial [Neotoma lepida]
LFNPVILLTETVLENDEDSRDMSLPRLQWLSGFLVKLFVDQQRSHYGKFLYIAEKGPDKVLSRALVSSSISVLESEDMESALMIGVIPVLYSTASDKSVYYVGRTLWLGLMSVYSIVVYVVRMPWYHIYEDFKCHENIPYSCLMECFEQTFTIPVSEMWCYFYFIFIILFFLMEFFIAQIRHKHLKEKVSIQTVSFCLLTNKHLPLISKNNFHCSTDGCPGPYHCIIWEISEKQLSVYTLSIFSIIIIIDLCEMLARHSSSSEFKVLLTLVNSKVPQRCMDFCKDPGAIGFASMLRSCISVPNLLCLQIHDGVISCLTKRVRYSGCHTNRREVMFSKCYGIASNPAACYIGATAHSSHPNTVRMKLSKHQHFPSCKT